MDNPNPTRPSISRKVTPTGEMDSESESDMESHKKMFKRMSTFAEGVRAFQYRSPGRGTLLNCSLASVATPERITQELVQCAREGDVDTLQAIVTALGRDMEKHVNALDEQRLTPLHYAAQYNHPDIVDVLLKHKADVNIPGDEDARPSHYAAMPTRGKKVHGQRPLANNEAWTGTSCVAKLAMSGADFSCKDIYGQTPLHYSAIHGNVVAARDILALGNKTLLQAEDNQQMTALHAAALYNEVGVAKLLLDNGAVILCDDHEQSTPLHHACASGNLELVKLLFEMTSRSANEKSTKLLVDDQDIEGSTCLHLAVENGHSEVATLCIQKGADVNKSRADGDFPLHLAVVSGKSEIVRFLLDKGARVNSGNDSQATPLHKAAQFNKVKVARLLLRRGANIESLDRDNDTPLLIASTYGQVDMVAMLLKKGADLNATNLKEKTSIYLAAEEGNLAVLKVLFQMPYSQSLVTWGDRNGNTALHIAAQKKNLQIVKVLLENKAPIHNKNELEETPLHWAAKHGNVHAIREIVKYEANAVFAEDEKSNTPLHFAAQYGHDQCVSALIDLGADVAQKNCTQWTALDLAASLGWKDTCGALLEADAPIDPTDKRDTTPLHLACSNGHCSVVQLLLKWNANVTKRDRDGMSCLDLAIENTHREVAHIIVQSDKWKEALRHAQFQKKRSDVKVDTPMRRLIRRMPEIAKEVFDRCITPGEEQDPTEELFEQHYNYEFIDDLYADWAQPEKPPVKSKRDAILRKVGISKKLKPYSRVSKTIKENHPMMVMVTSNQEHLLAHPLVKSLLLHKWGSFGAWYYVYSFLLHACFVGLLTNFCLKTLSPHRVTDADATAILSGSCSGISSDLLAEQTEKIEKDALIFILALCIFNEVIQMYQSRLAYFSMSNMTEWVVYMFTILVLIDLNECQAVTGMRNEWQWSLAAMAVFLGWIDLVLFVQGFSSLGIYVVMFRDILFTFLKAITVFFVLILAFAIAFCVLLQNQVPFRDVGHSLIKTFVMIIGEYDFNDIFNAGVDTPTPDTRVYYPTATYILFAGFVVLASIVLMNLLVGLAVDDIKGILRQAALRRMAMQVHLTMDVEKMMPDFIRQKFFVKVKVTMPNLESGNPLKQVYNTVSSWWTTDPSDDEDAVLREIPKIRRGQEKMERQLKEIKRVVKTVHNMHVQNKRIESMLCALLKHSDNVSWQEEDYSSDDDRVFQTSSK